MIILKIGEKKKSFENIKFESDVHQLNRFLGISSCGYSSEYNILCEIEFYRLMLKDRNFRLWTLWDDRSEMSATEWVRCAKFLLINSGNICELNDTNTDLSKVKYL